jgi:Zn-finger in Ran binding protein and others.
MAQKIIGYIQLVWTCDHCGTQNPGAIKSCTSCGAPQPPDVQFTKVDPETFDFIKDEALIRMAQSGPDKHCPYCGTRNAAEAGTCSKCGSDISVGAKVRESGGILESQSPSQPGAPPRKLSRGAVIILILGLLALCGLIFTFIRNLTRTDQVSAVVSGSAWQRSLQILAYQQVSESDWESAIPSNAQIVSCSPQHRYDSDTPRADATEVCGEPYTVDTGTGIGQVVQDCVYQVYENYCSYTSLEWVPIDTLNTSGYDLNPYWPSVNLGETQRLGSQEERYTIYFSSGGETYTFYTKDADLYLRAQPGSAWTLDVNRYGSVSSAKPAQ